MTRIPHREKNMPVHCFAAHKAKARLKPFSYAQKRLGSNDVRIRVTHCGICHSDIHLIDNDWGISSYPLVPGHEVVGDVTEAGSRATHLKIGTRVGVGWQAGSCMKCEWCKGGNENLCTDSRAVCLGNYGGYGEEIRVDGRFVFPIPADLCSKGVAPLLCGGATVFSPLHRFEVGRGMKVGVLGIGGLGHLAVRFARAMGADVTALSASPDKEAEVRKMGASRFILTTKGSQMKKAEQSLDFLLSTVNVGMDWEAYLNVLKPRGTLCIVGVVPGKINFPSFPLIVQERNVVGSVIGSRSTIKDMLNFAAKHRIESKSEVTKLADVNSALNRVRRNQTRYRMVLEIPALGTLS